MTADVLSDLLRAVRLSAATCVEFEPSSPWVVEAPPAREIVDRVMPGAERVIEFHLIARGTCWGHAFGEQPRRLQEGDLIVFPQGDRHVLSSAPGMRAGPHMQPSPRASTPLPMFHELGGHSLERWRVVSLLLGCEGPPFNPLLAALPPVIHVTSTGHGAAAGWLGTLLSMAARESGSSRAGRTDVLSRLSELMLVETIRHHLERLPTAPAGWLAGLGDPNIGRALRALHREPGHCWTVGALARIAGLSRSVFAERFATIVEQPPMQYLASWRIQVASRRLLAGGRLTEVAGAVGYRSEAAFSRAFKRFVGESPASWRKRVNDRS